MELINCFILILDTDIILILDGIVLWYVLIMTYHYSDVIWASWRVKLPGNRLFVSQIIQAKKTSLLLAFCEANPPMTIALYNPCSLGKPPGARIVPAVDALSPSIVVPSAVMVLNM